MRCRNNMFYNCIVVLIVLGLLLTPIMPGAWAYEAGSGNLDTTLNISNLVTVTKQRENGQNVVSGEIPDADLQQKLIENPGAKRLVITLNGDADVVRIELSGGQATALADRKIEVELQAATGSIIVPAAQVDLPKLAGKLNAPPAQVMLNITVGRPMPEQVTELLKITGKKAVSMAAEPILFKIEAQAGEEKAELTAFDSFVTRTVNMDKPVDINTAVAVQLRSNGIAPVPTEFTETNGRTEAVIKQKTTGVYTVIDNPRDFGDIKNHWARNDINTLAAKLVISGMDNATFAPQSKVTRAQLAAMAVGALGLESAPAGTTFKDVRGNDWYAGAVGAAAGQGIIKGFSDKTFRPKAYVSREQVAVILVQALKTSTGVYVPDKAGTAEYLARFRDNKAISPWARPFVAAAVRDGLINGDSTGAFAPQKISTRAEAAVMIRKMMRKAGFITPNFEIIAPSDNFVTNKKSIQVTGNIEPGSSVSIDGEPGSLGTDGKFSAQAQLRNGSNTVKITVVDRAGRSMSAIRKVIYDVSAPTFRVTAPEDKLITNKGLLTVTGAVESGSTVRVNDLPVDYGEEGNFSKVIALNGGKNEITVTARDAVGNEKTISRTVTYDSEPPLLAVASPQDGVETGSNLVVVTGYTEPGSKVKVNDESVEPDKSGNFSKVIDLEVYSNIIPVTATDAAGNKTEVIRTVVFNDNRVTGLMLPDQVRIGSNAFIQYSLSMDGYVTISIFDEDDDLVRTLATEAFKTAGTYMQGWDGRDGEGGFIGDGNYKFVVELTDKSGERLGRAEKRQVAARIPVISGLTDSPDPLNPLAGEYSTIKFKLSSEGLVTVVVYKGYTPVRNIAADMEMSDGDNSINWDGRDDAGMLAGDGVYTYQVDAANAIDASFRSTSKGTITVEKEAPQIKDLVVSPDPFKPGPYGGLNISFNLSEAAKVTVKILDKDGKLVKTLSNNVTFIPGTNNLAWDGKRADGKPAAYGAYKLVISAVDSAGKISLDTVKPFTIGEPKPAPPPPPEAEEYSYGQRAARAQIMSVSENVTLSEVSEPAAAEEIVTGLSLSENPFGLDGRLYITYTLAQDTKVTLRIKDQSGNTARTLINDSLKFSADSPHFMSWDGKGTDGNYVSEGTYRVSVSVAGYPEKSAEFTAAYKPTLTGVQMTPSTFEPGDGETTSCSFNLSRDALVTVEIIQSGSTIIEKEQMAPGPHIITWDGRNSAGDIVPGATYTLAVTAESPAASGLLSTASVPVVVINQAATVPTNPTDLTDSTDPSNPPAGIPTTTTLTVTPDPLRIGGQSLSISYTLSQDSKVTLYVKDSNGTTIRTLLNGVLRKTGMVNMSSWDGKDGSGSLVTAGNYSVVLNISGTNEVKEAGFYAAYKPAISGLQVTRSPFNPVNSENTSFIYTLSHDADVSVQIMNGTVPLKTLMDKVRKTAGPVEDSWDGRDSVGNFVPDGTYTIELRAESPSVSAFYSTVKGTVKVEKGVPDIIGLTVMPDPFRADKSSSLLMRYQLSEYAMVSVGLYVYNTNTLVRAIATDLAKKAGYYSATWDGKNNAGNLAGNGKYTVVVTAVDEYGNKGETKAYFTFYQRFGVESSEPKKDATAVPRDARIVINFNDFAKKGANIEDISLEVEGRPVQHRIEFTGRTLTVIPSAELVYGTKYVLTIPIGAITDAAGKLMAEYVLAFTTETAPRENVVEVSLSKAIVSSASVDDNRSVTTVKVDQPAALDILKQNGNANVVVIPVITDTEMVIAELSGGLVKDVVYRGMSVKIQSPKAALLIPPSEFDLKALARQLDVDEFKVKYYITLASAGPEAVTSYQNAVRKTGLALAANPVTFSLEVEGDGNRLGITQFAKRISLLIYLPANVSPNIGGITLRDRPDLLPVPVSFAKDSGRNAAVVKTKVAGTYGVVESKKVFRDMAGHWANKDVALLTGRMVVSGVNADNFAPNNRVTRAQFVTMIVKALGLEPGSGYTRFSDINPGGWYAGVVTAALDAGIISGYEDGTFRPHGYIKREEAAAIICRALELLEMKVVVDEEDADRDLDKFRDDFRVSPWAKTFVAGAARSGLIRGYKDGTFAPGKNITRAEGAVLVKQLLSKAGLI